MQNNRFVEGVRRAYARYDRLMEKQGFYIVLAVCVLVIVLSALYTFEIRDQWEEPPAAAEEEALAAGGSQEAQTLSDAKALVESQGAQQFALPTQAPLRFTQPVEGFTDRGFSVTEPQFFSKTNVWQVHPGIDLLSDYGAVVKACASGSVSDVWEDNQLGLCVRMCARAIPWFRDRPSGMSETASWPKAMRSRTCIWRSGRTAGPWIPSLSFWGLTTTKCNDTL